MMRHVGVTVLRLTILSAALLGPGHLLAEQGAEDDGSFGVEDGQTQRPGATGSTASRQAGDASKAGDGVLSMDTSGSRPDQYSIQRGDTLWSISGQFWGDSFFWPKLWSYNPYIGNAHLIYPGNILHLYEGSYVRPPGIEQGAPATSAVATVQQEVQASPEQVVKSSGTVCAPYIPFLEQRGHVKMRADGFLREEGFGPLGKVVRAPEGKLMLSERDLVYIQFSRVSDVQCGDVYTLYEPTRKKVYHPIYHRRVVGSLYKVLGEVQVVDVNDFVATGRIVQAVGEVERGALVTERLDRKHDVLIQPNSKEIEGFIVEGLNQENSTLGPRDLVYIDRGEEDGVRPGDSFYIVRQGDGLEGRVSKGKRDISLPFQIVGKVVVLEPGGYVSQAVITEANQVIEVGDSITSQVD